MATIDCAARMPDRLWPGDPGSAQDGHRRRIETDGIDCHGMAIPGEIARNWPGIPSRVTAGASSSKDPELKPRDRGEMEKLSDVPLQKISLSVKLISSSAPIPFEH